MRRYGPSSKSEYDFEVQDEFGRWGLGYVTSEFEDHEEDELDTICNALEGDLTALVVVDVTGTRKCLDNAVEFVTEAFEYGKAVAQDDYSPFLWTRESISKSTESGKSFFQP